MKKISADLLLPMDQDPIPDGILHIDDSGKILHIEEGRKLMEPGIHHYRGALLPGWVNAHCHLELSHMSGVIPTGTGLIEFIKQVVQLRDFDKADVLKAIKEQDQLMYEDGIVAVGDISNTSDTVLTKRTSRIRYYTFVELFDLLQAENAEKSVKEGLELRKLFRSSSKDRATLVPHASYSVSSRLMQSISEWQSDGEVLSIHNQETEEEDLFFREGIGGFVEFYQGFGLPLDTFIAPQTSSLQYLLPFLKDSENTLFVHNTCTAAEDVRAAMEYCAAPYFVTCPNANLYIENRLPDYSTLLSAGAELCIGTDSLSSNWQLSVMEEVRTLLRYNSYLDWKEVLKWATFNGARALKLDAQLGSLTPGKSPGIIHLDIDVHAEHPIETRTRHYRIL